MKIDCIGCLHGHFPKLDGGDLLIVTGDLTARDERDEYVHFVTWARHSGYKKIIVIGGNHDNLMQNEPKFFQSNHQVKYLCDFGTEFKGLKIWGSPWTKTFQGINPKCKAFTVDTEEQLAEKWALIPDDTDILITHGPPYGVLDGIPIEDGSLFHAGSHSLNKYLNWDGGLKLHVFSHIHEGYGEVKTQNGIFATHSVNCSIMNEHYEPINKPIRVEIC